MNKIILQLNFINFLDTIIKLAENDYESLWIEIEKFLQD